MLSVFLFFFKQKTAYELRISDWSSDVCSSDLFPAIADITSRVDVPVLVMTYRNPVLQYGVDRYADDLAAAGGAGLITPDITPESAGEWIAASERTGLDRVFLAAPTSSDERLQMIAAASTGFVYTVSTMGITGERAQLDAAARTLVARLRANGAERACVGIGISTAEQVAGVVEYADGAIVGRSEEHTSELQSLMRISYAVFCLKKKK